MNFRKIFIVTITLLLVIVISFGKLHWDEKVATQATVFAENRTVVTSDMKANDSYVNTKLVNLRKLILDYEEQFGEVLMNYQDQLDQLILVAEQEYYTEVFMGNNDFRSFVLQYSNQAEAIREQVEIDYISVYHHFSQQLVSLGYLAEEADIYLILFEEIATDIQMSFITELISFQTI